MKTYNPLLTSLFVCVLLWVSPVEAFAQNKEDLSLLMEEARNAGIEASSLSVLQNRAQAHGMGPQQLNQILHSALAMSRQNLPADMAIDKALEGFSKGIPGERIIPAVSRVQNSMKQAADLVDPWLKHPGVQQMMNRSDETISQQEFRNEMARAASRSLMRDITQEHVKNILSRMESETVLSETTPPDMIAAVGVLSDLPTTADQPGASASFIVRALEGGFNANELRKLPAALKMGQQRSQLPASSVIEGVGQQMKGGVPAEQILQNLFNGNVGGGPPGNIPKGLDRRPDNKGNKGNKDNRNNPPGNSGKPGN